MSVTSPFTAPSNAPFPDLSSSHGQDGEGDGTSVGKGDGRSEGVKEGHRVCANVGLGVDGDTVGTSVVGKGVGLCVAAANAAESTADTRSQMETLREGEPLIAHKSAYQNSSDQV